MSECTLSLSVAELEGSEGTTSDQTKGGVAVLNRLTHYNSVIDEDMPCLVVNM